MATIMAMMMKGAMRCHISCFCKLTSITSILQYPHRVASIYPGAEIWFFVINKTGPKLAQCFIKFAIEKPTGF
jgi:hypothetical protein